MAGYKMLGEQARSLARALVTAYREVGFSQRSWEIDLESRNFPRQVTLRTANHADHLAVGHDWSYSIKGLQTTDVLQLFDDLVRTGLIELPSKTAHTLVVHSLPALFEAVDCNFDPPSTPQVFLHLQAFAGTQDDATLNRLVAEVLVTVNMSTAEQQARIGNVLAHIAQTPPLLARAGYILVQIGHFLRRTAP